MARVRRYMAFSMLTRFAVGALYRRLSDCFPGEARAEGFRLSFARAVLIIGIVLVLFLHAWPRPPQESIATSKPI